MVRAYLQYLLQARDEHSLHSPFVFDLYTQVIQVNDVANPEFVQIQQLRQQLRQRPDRITITDLGAGSKVNAARQRTIADIARHTQKPDRFGRLLFRLVHRFQAKTVFDLGTSLGVTTAYLAQATNRHGGQVTTFEGCPETARVAQQNLATLNVANVRLVVGNLDKTLAQAVAKIPSIDLVFFDANHRYNPTLAYFETCLAKVHNDTVFVFDDIHWSAEMEKAWQVIKTHPRVRVTIDLFDVGLVFFRQEQPKQHFTLRF